MRWLLEQFLASDRAAILAPATQRDYRWLARKVIAPLPTRTATFGEMPIVAIKPRTADLAYGEMRKEHGDAAAHYAARFTRRVWKWAARQDLAGPVNPWAGMELEGLPARSALWTPDQVAAVVAEAARVGRPSIGIATLLAYWFGHRQADVLGLTWTALEAGIVETRKTGRMLPIDVAAYPELMAALNGVNRSSTHVVVREAKARRGGKPPMQLPYQRHTFSHEWRAIATAAGIPADLQFRDLRATALTDIADAGAGIIPMTTHGGHQTVQMNRRYARPTVAQFKEAARLRLEHRAISQGNSRVNRETGSKKRPLSD